MRLFAGLCLTILSLSTHAQDVVGRRTVAGHVSEGGVNVEDIEQSLASGVPTEALIMFDDTAVEREASALRERRHLRFDDAEVLSGKARHFARVKSRALGSVDAQSYTLLRNFSHLPVALIRFKNRRALDQLRAHPETRAAYPNRRKYPSLDAVSAGLVGQPAMPGFGLTGAGTTVLVVDTGVDYSQPDFGPCAGVGAPAATCKVVYTRNLAGTGGNLDTSGPQHGTNVAGIVVGVAPGTRIASINVFGTSASTTDALILQAINWGIAHQATYNIRAINLSLGDGSANTAPCANPSLNPYVTALANARSAGILTMAAAGNEGYSNAIANPACTPGAVSVGAVYSQNWGNVSGLCNDATTSADQVACFSNSASFLSMLAPGAFITAGGRQLAGTSQATSFISGTVAILRALYPGDTLDQTLARITSHGVSVTDSRNGVITPRLSLYDIVRPANDDLSARLTVSGSTGSTVATSLYASKEASEPSHGGNPGGRSVWWRWTAPATGQVALNTHGSGFDTLLAVYTGTFVASLTPLASNDDDGFANGASGLYFQAQSGAEYEFAVDGADAASGAVSLAWQLNTAATANLRIATTINPASVALRDMVSFDITIVNDGPQPATNVQATGTLPAQFTYVSGRGGCTTSGSTFTCSYGTLLVGASGSATLQLRAESSGATQLSVVATSQVSDPVPANDTSSVQIVVASGSRSVPFPPWAMVLMAPMLAAIGATRGARESRPERSVADVPR